MSIMLAMVACGGGNQTPTTKTFGYTGGNQTVTIPASVANLTLLTGQGGRGSPEDEDYVQRYDKNTKTYIMYENGQIVTTDQGTTSHSGVTPADYCDPQYTYSTSTGQRTTQNCYYHTDTS